MFLLHWEVYFLMELVVNLPNKDLNWSSGKRTFIDVGVYMHFRGGVGSRLFLLFSCSFAFSCGQQMFLLVSAVPKDSGGREPVSFVVSKQHHQKHIYGDIYIYIIYLNISTYTHIYT